MRGVIEIDGRRVLENWVRCPKCGAEWTGDPTNPPVCGRHGCENVPCVPIDAGQPSATLEAKARPGSIRETLEPVIADLNELKADAESGDIRDFPERIEGVLVYLLDEFRRIDADLRAGASKAEASAHTEKGGKP